MVVSLSNGATFCLILNVFTSQVLHYCPRLSISIWMLGLVMRVLALCTSVGVWFYITFCAYFVACQMQKKYHIGWRSKFVICFAGSIVLAKIKRNLLCHWFWILICYFPVTFSLFLRLRIRHRIIILI